MSRKQELSQEEKSVLEAASALYQEIGSDLASAAGLGDGDSALEDDEVASVLQDRLREYLEEEKYGTDIVRTWDSLTPSKKHAICMRAL